MAFAESEMDAPLSLQQRCLLVFDEGSRDILPLGSASRSIIARKCRWLKQSMTDEQKEWWKTSDAAARFREKAKDPENLKKVVTILEQAFVPKLSK